MSLVLPVQDGSSLPQDLKEEIRRIAVEAIKEHRGCDVGNLQRCDMYYDLVQIMVAMAQRAREAERALLICGHPAACQQEDGCMACQREQRITMSAERLS